MGVAAEALGTNTAHVIRVAAAAATRRGLLTAPFFPALGVCKRQRPLWASRSARDGLPAGATRDHRPNRRSAAARRLGTPRRVQRAGLLLDPWPTTLTQKRTRLAGRRRSDEPTNDGSGA